MSWCGICGCELNEKFGIFIWFNFHASPHSLFPPAVLPASGWKLLSCRCRPCTCDTFEALPHSQLQDANGGHGSSARGRGLASTSFGGCWTAGRSSTKWLDKATLNSVNSISCSSLWIPDLISFPERSSLQKIFQRLRKKASYTIVFFVLQETDFSYQFSFDGFGLGKISLYTGAETDIALYDAWAIAMQLLINLLLQEAALKACQDALRKAHGLGIYIGDSKFDNFLCKWVHPSTCWINWHMTA